MGLKSASPVPGAGQGQTALPLKGDGGASFGLAALQAQAKTQAKVKAQPSGHAAQASMSDRLSQAVQRFLPALTFVQGAKPYLVNHKAGQDLILDQWQGR